MLSNECADCVTTIGEVVKKEVRGRKVPGNLPHDWKKQSSQAPPWHDQSSWGSSSWRSSPENRQGWAQSSRQQASWQQNGWRVPIFYQSQQESAGPLPYASSGPHRSDLCEGCKIFGDCSGIFLEPQQVYLTACLLEKHNKDCSQLSQGFTWNPVKGHLELNASFGSVRIQPHVYRQDHRPTVSEQSLLEGDRSAASRPSQDDDQSNANDATIRSSEDDAVRRFYQRPQ